MGLDTVELLMDVEETFDIEISDKEASEIETVGEFYDVVLTKLEAQNQGWIRKRFGKLCESALLK